MADTPMRLAISVLLSVTAGVVAALVALAIARVTGGGFSPFGGALVGLAFGTTAGNIARPAGTRRASDTILCALVAAAAAWLVVGAMVP